MTMIAPDLLATFLAVADGRSFTRAAKALGLRQSTVSQQIGRLETLTGRRLIDRDTHRVALTVDGEMLFDHARRVLDAHALLEASLSDRPLRGRLRLGASEDFVLSALPDVLAAFVRRHPDVDLELRAGLSHDLYDAFDAGLLDVIFVKRRTGDRRGTTAWREPIRWVAHPDFRLDPVAPLPLLLYPPPSVTRALAIETLERAGRSWRIAFTSASLTGLSAAARAGIGLMPHSARLSPAQLAVVAPHPSLPVLPEIEFVVIGPGAGNPVADALIAAMLHWAGVERAAHA
ncbi:LysR substrate-binding domain-containing protein [Sphingomonas sp. NFR15]|uniref:LysR substrate-binding domain-containing protein n=1 Tax=Sphingomonas sp. NFR15 TaxID=1566282 RepID=UPI000889E097|nr:LysR substrate-binding domain-containing protein [Sphingomonas sp. NFR15]SDA29310.1 DNA-binding transcriptional regulator, LysR family [Sphingomonas sp. NFR15]